jgi:alpha-beta hydrolase superfamily lysophospholipase
LTTSCPEPGLRLALEESAMANLEIADETAERVLGHSLGGLMATYNVSRHRKQKMAALVALEASFGGLLVRSLLVKMLFRLGWHRKDFETRETRWPKTET